MNRVRSGFTISFKTGASIICKLDRANIGYHPLFSLDIKNFPGCWMTGTSGIKSLGSAWMRSKAASFFTVFRDGTNSQAISNCISVRFDQWLVHHLLGTAYPADPISQDMSIAADRAMAALAYDIAGIQVDENDNPVRSLENEMATLPWFLLYASQAGNNLAGIDFETWLLANYGMTPSDVERTQTGRVWLHERLADYGTTIGIGFVALP